MMSEGPAAEGPAADGPAMDAPAMEAPAPEEPPKTLASGRTHRALGLVLALVLETLVAMLLWEASTASLATAVVVHLAGAGSAAVGFGRRRDEAYLAGALVLTLPVAGALGLGLTRLAEELVPPSPVEEGEHNSLEALPSPERAPESLDTVFDWLQNQLDVRPLGDVIRWGEPGAQQWAIQLLSKRDDGESVNLLRQALGSPDRTVQLAATTAVQRIEERISDRIRTAQERTRRSPELAASWVELGEACRTYCQSQLLEPVMESHWLSEAEAAYRKSLTLEPMSASSRLALARILVGRGEMREAEPHIRAVIRLAPTEEADLLLAGILAAQGRWHQLAESCRAAHDSGRINSEFVTWWAQTGQVEPGGRSEIGEPTELAGRAELGSTELRSASCPEEEML